MSAELSGARESWQPGESASYEYHCLESGGSQDAALWYRSHQRVTVLGRGADEDHPGTFTERTADGCPRVYRVRFGDGYESDAFEDELLDGPAWFTRPDPPKGGRP